MNIDKIKEHYEHAKEKHPYFCDLLLPRGYSREELRDYVDTMLSDAREKIQIYSEDHILIFPTLLNCEVWEINEALVAENHAAAVEECYDAIAVLLRVIDVLEGRQALGNPEKKEVENVHQW